VVFHWLQTGRVGKKTRFGKFGIFVPIAASRHGGDPAEWRAAKRALVSHDGWTTARSVHIQQCMTSRACVSFIRLYKALIKGWIPYGENKRSWQTVDLLTLGP